MKLVDGVVAVEDGKDLLLVTTRKVEGFSGMVRLNHTAGAIVKALKEEKSEDELVEVLTSQYEVGEDEARLNVRNVIKQLSEIHVVK